DASPTGPAVLRGRTTDPITPCREARRTAGCRRGRDEPLRLRGPAAGSLRLARLEVDRGRARPASEAARRTRSLQAAAGPRQASGFHSAGGPLYARRRCTNVDGGRVPVRRLEGGRDE